MKPSECKTEEDLKKLDHQGIKNNSDEFAVEENFVEIKYSHFTFRMPRYLFERYAKWYFEDQESLR